MPTRPKRVIRVIWTTIWSKLTHDNIVAWGTLVLAIATAGLVLVALSTDHKYGRQVTAMGRQVAAMEHQLANTTDNGLRQLRAYLLFDSGHIKKQGRERYGVILSVKNSGLTPAYNVRHSWGMRVYEYPLPGPVPFGPVDFEPVNERQSADIGASISFTLDDLKKLTITQAEKDDIIARKKAIYVWAKLDYKDTFQRPQCTWFATVNFNDPIAYGWELRSYFHVILDNPTGCPTQPEK